MSLVAHYLSRAAAKTADQAIEKLRLDDWTARKLAPIAVSLVMYALRREAGNLVGATALVIALNCYTEDLLENEEQLGGSDLLFRGETILERHFGTHRHRAAMAVSDLAMIDYDEALAFLALAAAAVVSALSKARRELKLDIFQLQGVVKSEAASFDSVDAALFADLRDWVFRPAVTGRFWKEMWTGLSQGMRRGRREPQFLPAE